MPENHLNALDQFDELLSRYLDDRLGEDEESQLLHWLSQPQFAERFLAMTKLSEEIAGLLAAPVPDETMAELVLGDLRKGATTAETPSRLRLQKQERQVRSVTPVRAPVISRIGKRRKPFRFGIAWAAIVVALLALAGIYFSGVWSSVPQLQVTSVTGEVYFTDESGRRRVIGQQALKDGRFETVGSGSSITIGLGDGTRVDVDGDSLLTTQSRSDKPRFYLENGSIRSHITLQPKDHPLKFATAEAEATVQGTTLSLRRWHLHTRLEVTAGQVLLKRPDDGSQILVPAGYHVLVGTRTKLLLSPNDPQPKHR